MIDPADETTRKRAGRPSEEAPPFLVFRLHGPRGVAREVEPLQLTPGATPIGRAVTRGLVSPDDDQMSRQHATLLLEPGAATVHLIDQSKNGCSVNGSPTREAALRDGDVIRTGDTLWLLRQARLGNDAEVAGLLGRSPVMREVRALIALVARTPATVLLLGESGTGKEVAARALHQLSGRSGALVTVNASAIPESLAESELFGHAAGAFTGARGAQPGLLRESSGGTLVLDEIGDLALPVQPKLLRALEERSVRALGGGAPTAVDLRLVAATNQDLEARIANGRFRGDLYARLAEIVIEMPPLRRRREDVLILFAHALGSATPLSPDLAEALVLHPWPYNVRELGKLAVEASVRGGGHPLQLELLAGRLQPHNTHPTPLATRAATVNPTPTPTPTATPAAAPAPARDAIPTRAQLDELLRTHQGEVAAIARACGRSRKQVYRWIEQHGLDLERYRRGAS
ncbi:MAG: sigma 54-interacting transcriptional regulator [Deltaproteobacteria bacterium]|nr:sigma 54-interacting transcriptional regulator [Deltaproteobacteria bacterium]